MDPDARPGRVHWFKAHGGLTRANGQRFRDMVLSRGNTLELGGDVSVFAGHDPQIEPYLEYYGLPTTPVAAAAASCAGRCFPPAPAPAVAPAKGERGRLR